MQYWNFDLVGHLHYHWPEVEDRFDTIIIDEAQDFSPAWIAQMEALLDPDGARRIMMVADAEQDIFDRGFTLPTAADGWTVCELTTNCRNTFQIARLLRSALEGAVAPQRGPESIGISYSPVGTNDDGVVEAVRQALEATDLKSVAVIVHSRRWRGVLRDRLNLGTWETRDEMIPCETVRRLKGTEFDYVVVVDPDGSMDDQSLYVAISRAVNQLAVIGPTELGRHLRLL
jgi:superfamily I DNA/RNA helicase